ncbi:MAG: hypothetical protein U9M92_03510 [Patescibacteria group bacterium]|nr:hypothetical protein [Patescibacteria group bacterium]
MKKIAVIGNGYVGKAVTQFFKGHFEVITRDIDKEYLYKDGQEKITNIKNKRNWKNVNSADFVVICVPTPP